MTKRRLSPQNITTILVAVIGMIGVVAAAYFAFREKRDPVELTIGATQTAEAKLLAQAEFPTSTAAPTQTGAPTATSTETIMPTLPPSSTPTPAFLVDTSSLMGWVPNFESSKGDLAKNTIATVEDALQLNYDVGKDGYIILTKNVDAQELSDKAGISFLYRGAGKRNSIEFKLMLRYPGADGDTTYGILWPRATDTENTWVEMNVLYSDLRCWWPAAHCTNYGDLLDPTRINRLDFVVSNKPGDDPGSGWVLFKDVLAIEP